MKAQFIAGEVKMKPHQSPTAMKPHRCGVARWVFWYGIERNDSLIPGIITVVFRDRNTNAVPKFSLTAAKRFILAKQQVQGTSAVSVNL